MQIFRRRPLAVVCFVFLLASVLAACTTGPARLFACLPAVLFLCLHALRLRRLPHLRRPCRFAAVLALVLLFALVRGYFVYERPQDRYAAQYGTGVTVTARITEVKSRALYTDRYAARLTAWEGEAASGGILFSLHGETALSVGDCVTFSGVFTAVSDGRSRGEALPLLADGTIAVCEEAVGLRVLDASKTPSEALRTACDSARAALGRYFVRTAGDGGKLAGAMLLGERSLLSPAVRRDFRRAGLSHLLALSGLHVSALTGALAFLLTRLPLGRKTRNAILLSCLWAFAFFVGFPLSVVRAAGMLSLVLLAFFAARRQDGMTSLFFASAVILLVDPFAVFDAGYWLSVAATFGILVYAEARTARNRMRQERGFPRLPGCETQGKGAALLRKVGLRVADSLLVSFSALTATLALSALLFGEFSPVSPLTNLLFGPFFALFLVFAVLLVALGWIPFVGQFIGLLGDGLCAAVALPAGWSFSLLPAHDAPFLLALITGSLVLFALLIVRTRLRTFLSVFGGVLGTCTLVFLALQLARAGQDLALLQSDGTNDLLLLRSGGRAVVCDVSDGTWKHASHAETLLYEAGLCEMDAYVVTHYHAYTVTSFSRLANNHLIRRLYLPEVQEKTEQVYRDRLLAAAEERGTDVIFYTPNTPFTCLDYEISLITAYGTTTHPPLSLTVLHDGGRLTYVSSCAARDLRTADAVGEAVAASDILFFGTHGRTKGEVPFFPAYYDASLAHVFLSAAHNPLPPDLMAEFEAHGIPVTRMPDKSVRIRF